MKTLIFTLPLLLFACSSPQTPEKDANGWRDSTRYSDSIMSQPDVAQAQSTDHSDISDPGAVAKEAETRLNEKPKRETN